ncbi:MAG: long-chain fatty acid--CoA ligase [Alphaproteobacteria bacterium]|nr:long-chain fatty acid--CoA ligase [Alphaproteobacteria bacterium]
MTSFDSETEPKRISWLPFAAALRHPESPALAEGDTVWSYARYAAAIRGTAALFDRAGVRPGDRVMIVAENGLAAATAIMAASELDAWAVVVNARLAAPEIDAIRDHCRPRRIIYTVASSEDAARHGIRHGAQPVTDAELPGLALGPLHEVEPAPIEKTASRLVAALIYTSGTTGKPKGVMLSHRSLLFAGKVAAEARQFSRTDRLFAVLPLSHSYGISSVLIAGLMSGAFVRLVPRFTPESLVRYLAEDGLTVVQGVPAMYARLLEHLSVTGQVPHAPNLRFMSAGGSPLEPALRARVQTMFNTSLHNGYGLTEAAPVVALTRMDRTYPDGCIGEPADGVEVRVVGQDGENAPVGDVGELWARGPNIMLGYYKEPGLTRQVLTEDGWLKTGDLAKADAEGRYYIVGRAKELIIRAGFNVHPEDVEAVLNACPGVTLSGVVGRANGVDEDVIAFVQTVPGSEPTPDRIQAYAAERLAGYKRPSRIVVMPVLPVTLAGKVKKAALREIAKTLP